MEKNQLVVTNDKMQSTLYRLIVDSDEIDIEGLTRSMMPLILENKSIEDLAMERAKQLVGQLISRMERVTPDGELIPAFIKTNGENYKPIDQVDSEDLLEKKRQLNQRRTNMGVQMENLTNLGKQLNLPGMTEFEAERDYDSEAERHFLEKAKTEGLELTHNKEVGRYRIDFTVVEDGNPTHCNISILGEKWHKKKLPRDFARMRELTKEGELMIPFTAKQILSDPDRCVTEVKSIYSKWREALLN